MQTNSAKLANFSSIWRILILKFSQTDEFFFDLAHFEICTRHLGIDNNGESDVLAGEWISG